MNKRIEAAFERVAAIEERRQGHVVESSPEEKESKFEADIQDILGLLRQAEGEYHQGHFPMVLALVKDVRRKLVALAKVNENGYIGNGQKVHLVIREVGSYAYATCGAEGISWPTAYPVDCKVCLRHIVKAKGLEAK